MVRNSVDISHLSIYVIFFSTFTCDIQFLLYQKLIGICIFVLKYRPSYESTLSRFYWSLSFLHIFSGDLFMIVLGNY